MDTDKPNGINTLRYSDIFLAMYSDNGMSCLHRNHSHVLVYMYSGELEINERNRITRLHRGDCAFIRKDFGVQLTKQAWKGEQFKATFLMLTTRFLRDFYNRLDKGTLPEKARRNKVSLLKLPSSRPDIVSLFESMAPYFDSGVQPSKELLDLKMTEGVYVLLNTDQSLYASLFDFADPWKPDILEFMEKNYMNDLTPGEIANYTGRSLATFKRDFRKVSDLSPEMAHPPQTGGSQGADPLRQQKSDGSLLRCRIQEPVAFLQSLQGNVRLPPKHCFRASRRAFRQTNLSLPAKPVYTGDPTFASELKHSALWKIFFRKTCPAKWYRPTNPATMI